MSDVEFCLKSMCFMPYTHIVVREVSAKGCNILGGGYYDKVLTRFRTRKVVRSSVSGNVLYIDVSPETSSCDAFVCSHASMCVVSPCLGSKCPLCSQGGLCQVCMSRKACKK